MSDVLPLVGPAGASTVGAPPFDALGPLPEGTTVLEASAGTGKTWTIATLATRYVAEGRARLSQLLLVTFGRAATSELRDRVRERLAQVERDLRSTSPAALDDPLVRLLAGVPAAELDLRRERLATALADFDAATIATTHGFCQQMLRSLGLGADADPGAVLVPDIADLVDEVVDDLYLQRWSGTGVPPLTVGDAREVARSAAGDPWARLEPSDAAEGTVALERYRFAEAVRAEVEHRKRVRGLLDYDDLLGLLHAALTEPVLGGRAAARVRERFSVVLVDEFQDTDPVQWDILRLAFHGHRTLVLVGDPKQAIYAFRGGDVVAYLSARAEAEHVRTLDVNRRSDADLLRGIDHLLAGCALGDDRIVVGPVQAFHTRRRHDGPAVRLRQVTRPALARPGVRTPPGRLPAVATLRDVVAADVAADVVRQLRAGRLLDSERGEQRPVAPGDIAVLTRRNADALSVREALVASGVPAVVSGLASVFTSAAAQLWLTLLRALEQPGHPGRVAALALTPFVGWDARTLATAGDRARDDLADRVRSWAQVLARRGVAAVLETTFAAGLAERLLGTPSGERTLTDLRHVGQTLHAAALESALGLAALTDWLRRRIDEAGDDYAEERSRRLETDAAAVQVVTVHASKGLEFPVVYVPFAWDRYESDAPPVLRCHDGEQRVLHLGAAGSPGYTPTRERHLAEERGEDLRLLYVALTRACSQLVLWWGPSTNSLRGALSRLLLGRPEPGAQPVDRVAVGKDDAVADALSRLAGTSGGSVVHEVVDQPPVPGRWTGAQQPPDVLQVGRYRRGPDLAWRRTSYTGLTAAAHEASHGVAAGATGGGGRGGAGVPSSGVGSEPEVPGVIDEVDPVLLPAQARPGEPEAGTGAGPAPAMLPMAELPSGTAFGTLVHTVLEHVDTAAPDLRAELDGAARRAGSVRFPGVDHARLVDALQLVMTTPLGPLAHGRSLASVPPRDRLAELEFELPLAGGDRSGRAGAAGADGAAGTVGGIGDLLAAHLPDDDPFHGYAARLRDAPFAGTVLRGYLTGSLDAVLRLADPRSGEPRYVVVDYKTNRLAPADEPLTADHYRPGALVAAMQEADYPLQLLLYLVALHRYLRWRQPGYDPHAHLGGGLYLFVRGMTGPPPRSGPPAEAPGVLAWRPPAALVVALSAHLDADAGRRR